jgi:cytochrome c peroxidase
MSLHNVEKTGPYFHTGLFNTLQEVVQHYNKGGAETGAFYGTKDPKMRPLLLTDDEVNDIVEFLKSLTGALDPQLIINKAKPPL